MSAPAFLRGARFGGCAHCVAGHPLRPQFSLDRYHTVVQPSDGGIAYERCTAGDLADSRDSRRVETLVIAFALVAAAALVVGCAYALGWGR